MQQSDWEMLRMTFSTSSIIIEPTFSPAKRQVFSPTQEEKRTKQIFPAVFQVVSGYFCLASHKNRALVLLHFFKMSCTKLPKT